MRECEKESLRERGGKKEILRERGAERLRQRGRERNWKVNNMKERLRGRE